MPSQHTTMKLRPCATWAQPIDGRLERSLVFDRYATYGTEVWWGNVSASSWNEIKKIIQRKFLCQPFRGWEPNPVLCSTSRNCLEPDSVELCTENKNTIRMPHGKLGSYDRRTTKANIIRPSRPYTFGYGLQDGVLKKHVGLHVQHELRFYWVNVVLAFKNS